jgi:hypothetical protein
MELESDEHLFHDEAFAGVRLSLIQGYCSPL